jgi:hypothetical protein
MPAPRRVAGTWRARLRWTFEWPALRFGHDVVAGVALIKPDAIATLDLHVRALYHRSGPSEV